MTKGKERASPEKANKKERQQETPSNDFLPPEIFGMGREELDATKFSRITGISNTENLKVVRTNGKTEDGWYVSQFDPEAKTVTLHKEREGLPDVLAKTVPIKKLVEWNRQAKQLTPAETANRVREITAQLKEQLGGKEEKPAIDISYKITEQLGAHFYYWFLTVRDTRLGDLVGETEQPQKWYQKFFAKKVPEKQLSAVEQLSLNKLETIYNRVAANNPMEGYSALKLTVGQFLTKYLDEAFEK